MRQKLARVIGGVAMMALVAGGAACSSSDSGRRAAVTPAASKIAFFGALTGSSAALGINETTAPSWRSTSTTRRTPTARSSWPKFDSQGEPGQGARSGQQAIDDTKILGIVGPAFSGESEAADPIFDEAGLPTITPSATRPSLADQGLEDLPPRASATTTRRARRPANYIKNVLKAEKVFVVDDQSAYGAGLADEVKKVARRRGGRHGQGPGRGQADRLLRRWSPRSRPAARRRSSTAATTRRPACSVKQLTAAGWKGTLVAGDGVNDAGLHQGGRQGRRRGHDPDLPVRAGRPKAGGTFVADYKAQVRRRRRAPTATWRTTRRTSSWRASRPARPPARTCRTFVNGYNGKGVASELQVRPTTASWTRRRSRSGRSRSTRRQDRRRTRRSRSPDRRSLLQRLSRDPVRPGVIAPGRTGLLRPHGAPSCELRWTVLQFRDLTSHRPDPGRDLRPGRARLHPGLRRAAPDQLRALRGLHDRHVRRDLVWGCFGLDQNSPRPRRSGRSCSTCCVGADRRRWSPPAATALVVELVAYRPLRRRNAPPLAFLITAIGASFVHLRDRRRHHPAATPRACPR